MAFDVAGAKAAGYTDEEIQNYLGSKEQGVQSQPQAPSQTPQGPISKPLSKIPLVGGALSNIAQTGEQIGTGIKTAQNVDRVSKETSNYQTQATKMAKQAMNETNPERRKMLLDMSRKLSRISSDIIDSELGSMEDDVAKTGLDPNKGSGQYLERGLSTGFSAGELYSAPSLVKSAVNVAKSTVPAIKTSGSVLREMIKAEGLAKLNPGKAMSRLATEAAKNEPTKFTRAGFYDTLIDSVKGMETTIQRKAQKELVKDLAQESGKPVAELAKLSLDDLKATLPELFPKGSATTMAEALASRRQAASSGLAGLWKAIKTPAAKSFELSKNAAYNEQLHTIEALAKWDKTMSNYFKSTKIMKGAFGFYVLNKLLGGKGAQTVQAASTVSGL